MQRPIQDLVAFLVYLFFAAVEIVVTWGIFVIAFCGPIAVAWLFGAKTGDNLSAIALLAGLGLMYWWYSFLEDGGNKRIEIWFQKTSKLATKRLGARDAIED